MSEAPRDWTSDPSAKSHTVPIRCEPLTGARVNLERNRLIHTNRHLAAEAGGDLHAFFKDHAQLSNLPKRFNRANATVHGQPATL